MNGLHLKFAYSSNRISSNKRRAIDTQIRISEANCGAYQKSDHDLTVTNLTISVPFPDKKKKNNVNFYFHTSVWCLKRF